ncbi:hypothetical protein JCM24511_08416 [Saitozyma sp. JCM 24511]|jgi:hypothetical protein|nr:hypothetical protein JCM24511_08416 [Saitozyma sp. JCM 24511]
MSISLPNGTLLAAPSSSTQQYSAAVTRILHLGNFSPELKTRDLQAMFKEWENDKGGFRVKWVDDVNALIVFADAAVAKRAYLSFLLHPAPNFDGQIKPYDSPDAANIIQSLAARAMGHRSSMSSAVHGSMSFPSGSGNGGAFQPGSMGPPPVPESSHHGQSHGRAGSMSAFGSFSMPTRNSRASISHISGSGSTINNNNTTGGGGGNGRIGGGTGFHQRTGSASSFSRQPLTGVLNFNVPSSTAGRLPTHSESSADPSRASSSDGEQVIIMDPVAGGSAWKAGGGGPANGPGGRRESVSAEKALREVQKALASVEAQG